LDWRSDSAIATMLVFLCLLALLSKFAWRPVMALLEARERSIAAMIDDAKRSSEQAAEQLRQYEARLAAAADEARGIVDQARKEAEAAKVRIVAEAQDVALRERQRAIDDITTAKHAALQEMTQNSVNLAVALAGQLIRKQLRPEDHTQLIREMVDQFPSRN
jgi:F-type H+-transporting ATPase subunit b